MASDPDIPDETPPDVPDDGDDSPKFGRLLIVLALAVMLIIVITFATEAYYST